MVYMFAALAALAIVAAVVQTLAIRRLLDYQSSLLDRIQAPRLHVTRAETKEITPDRAYIPDSDGYGDQEWDDFMTGDS